MTPADIRKNAEEQQAKIRDAQAKAQESAGISANFTTHRIACGTCQKATTSKGLCGAGLSLWEHVMGRPPKVLIR